MIRTLRFLLSGILILVSGSLLAQGIYGTVVDEKKVPIIGAIVEARQGGIVKGGAPTDADGNYDIKPLDAGNYTIIVKYIGYDTAIITGISVPTDDEVKVDVNMKVHSNVLHEVTAVAYKRSMVGTLDHPISGAELGHMAVTQVVDAVSTSPGVYQAKRGDETNMGGARVEGTLYIIDGVQVQYIAGNRSGVNMSQGAVDEIEVSTSGIEAKYGDVSGGVVNITTRGVAQQFNGEVQAEHSLDGYNNNFINFSVAGPLLKIKDKRDSTAPKKPVMGFALSGDYHNDPDRYPSYIKQQNLKGSVLQSILQNPLVETTDNSGTKKFFLASDYVTPGEFVNVKVPPGNTLKEYTLNGKLDYQVTPTIHLVGGVNVDYVKQPLYNDISLSQVVVNVFDPGYNITQNNFSGRGFVRMTQKFANANDSGRGLISNAYYSIQFDFQRETSENINPTLKKNYFEYNYVGKFNETQQKLYVPGQVDSVTGLPGTMLIGTQSNGFTYQRAPAPGNSNLANYTSELYSLNENQPMSLNQIRSDFGILNGDNPSSTYSINGGSMFTSPGAVYNGYSYIRFDQYALTVDASLDLKTGKLKHAIQFGLYYQQRINSSFSVGTGNLWNLMRDGLVSTIDNGGLRLDKTNPIFIIDGKSYTKDQVYSKYNSNGTVITKSTDTIIYNYVNVQKSVFDQNLRKELGYTANQDINVENLDPGKLSLGMFSADQLLNSGGYGNVVSYMGYTYTGGSQTGTVNFNDFWTAKDGKGNYTRPIAAFAPNYVAGYIQDKFRYENIKFSLGVRIERYSTNTKVLSDPYSEYPEQSVNQVSGSLNTYNGSHHPGNMGQNYIVYVNDNSSNNPTIVGYRSGDNWYDPRGNYVSDPKILANLYGGGRDPQPLIQTNYKYTKISDSNYNPNLTFTDYVPQVNILPRIKLSFPISEDADFFAHYDIYAQRPYPNSIAWSTPYTYYYMSQNSLTGVLPNANLKPSLTYDYEAGFQQKLTSHSAVTITGFYKERKNMVDIVPYLYAWPNTYYTYGNRDFSTTKGSTVTFDFRTTNHLRMFFSYTLQFAEGTGSTYNSSNGGSSGAASGFLAYAISANQPNLRYVIPLSFDARHNFSANIDYRYGEGEGPMVGKSYIFENAGLNIMGTARSGEPYSRYTLPDNVSHTLLGGVNGSRLPWHYGINLKVDKDFRINYMVKDKAKADGNKVKKSKYVNVYLSVLNLLNTQDIQSVYGYTSKPSNDGYLTSAYGQRYVAQQVSPSSYSLLYNIYANNPGNYNYARTVNFGVMYKF